MPGVAPVPVGGAFSFIDSVVDVLTLNAYSLASPGTLGSGVWFQRQSKRLLFRACEMAKQVCVVCSIGGLFAVFAPEYQVCQLWASILII